MKEDDIIIYTTPEILEHKKKDGLASKGRFCYWTFNKFPSRIDELDGDWNGVKLYFATSGFIRGYFTLTYMSGFNIKMNELSWHSESWEDIAPIPIKHFQGFKYADKVEELNDKRNNA